MPRERGFRPPSRAEILRMDAERMAKDAVMELPVVKRLVKERTREITRIATKKPRGALRVKAR